MSADSPGVGGSAVSEEDGSERLVRSMVGRTIVRAEWFDPNPDEDWTAHEVGQLWLDDGRVIEFGAWGHDAWGATIREMEGGADG